MEVIIFTDGGSRGNPGIAGCGVVILDTKSKVLSEQSRGLGLATNNEAEYQGVILALEWVVAQQWQKLDQITFKLDSMLVVEQLSQKWRIKEPRLAILAGKIWQQLKTLPCSIKFCHIPRAQNSRADQLANEAMDRGTINN